jgi:hypothetical protein
MMRYLLRLLGFSAVYMAIPDASTVVAKWQQRSSAAAQDYAAGVQNTDKDPTALAIAAGQRYIQRVQESFNSGKWANGLRRVGKAGWQQAVTSKGVQNYTSGINAATVRVRPVGGGDRRLALDSELRGRVARLHRGNHLGQLGAQDGAGDIR